MKALLNTLVAMRLRPLVDRGLNDGLRGDGVWLAVGLVGIGVRVLGRMWPREQVVYRTVLAPGERLEIDHLVESFRELGVKP